MQQPPVDGPAAGAASDGQRRAVASLAGGVVAVSGSDLARASSRISFDRLKRFVQPQASQPMSSAPGAGRQQQPRLAAGAQAVSSVRGSQQHQLASHQPAADAPRDQAGAAEGGRGGGAALPPVSSATSLCSTLSAATSSEPGSDVEAAVTPRGPGVSLDPVALMAVASSASAPALTSLPPSTATSTSVVSSARPDPGSLKRKRNSSVPSSVGASPSLTDAPGAKGARTEESGAGEETKEPGGRSLIAAKVSGKPVYVLRTNLANLIIPRVPCDKKNPDQFVDSLLVSRGYETTRIPSLQTEFRTVPTPKQIQDYDLAFVDAIRTSNYAAIQSFYDEGRSMNACNKYGESVMHMACRRGDGKLVSFMVELGGLLEITDDYGRTPLHDACWTPEPCLDVVMFLLNKNLRLLHLIDKRGFSPLAYVRREHYDVWTSFFDSMKDTWWSPRNSAPTS